MEDLCDYCSNFEPIGIEFCEKCRFWNPGLKRCFLRDSEHCAIRAGAFRCEAPVDTIRLDYSHAHFALVDGYANCGKCPACMRRAVVIAEGDDKLKREILNVLIAYERECRAILREYEPSREGTRFHRGMLSAAMAVRSAIEERIEKLEECTDKSEIPTEEGDYNG